MALKSGFNMESISFGIFVFVIDFFFCFFVFSGLIDFSEAHHKIFLMRFLFVSKTKTTKLLGLQIKKKKKNLPRLITTFLKKFIHCFLISKQFFKEWKIFPPPPQRFPCPIQFSLWKCCLFKPVSCRRVRLSSRSFMAFERN